MNFEQMFFQGASAGMLSPNDVDSLRKAMATGYDVGGTSQTGAGAFRLESLDAALAVLSEQQHEIVFLNDLTSKSASSTAVEYARRTALAARNGGWLNEGELPEERDDTYDRAVAFIKYLGTLGSITLPTELVKNTVDPLSELSNAKMQWLNIMSEIALFKGDSKLGLNGAEFVEIDGLEKIIATAHTSTGEHIHNLWGRPLEEEDIRDANQTIVKYHGFGTHVYMPQLVAEDFAKSYLKSFMHRPADQDASGKLNVGFDIGSIRTVAGSLVPRPVFLYGGLSAEQPVTSVSALAPTPAPTTAIAIQATGTGEWENSLGIEVAADSGSVEYRVAIGNKYGETLAAVSVPASQAINFANRVNSVRVTITNPAIGYVNAPTYASIYRRDTNADGVVSAWGCIARVSLTSVVGGAAALVYDDDGDVMPGTYRAWVMRRDPEIISIRDLLPMTRMEMPMNSFAKRYAFARFMTLIVKDPFKFVQISNIARRTI